MSDTLAFVACAVIYIAVFVLIDARRARSVRRGYEALAMHYGVDPTGLPAPTVVDMIWDVVRGTVGPSRARLVARVADAVNVRTDAVTVNADEPRGVVTVTIRFPWWRVRRAKALATARLVAERYVPAWTCVIVEAAK